MSRPAPLPEFWRVAVWTDPASGGPKWLVLSRAGPRALDDEQARASSEEGPCVYLVPDDDSPEESERLDAMPRFKLLSADAWVLTGPQRDRPEPGEGRKEYAGGAAATTSNREDGRDLLEAYPAPVDDKYSPDVFPMYVWSPSRQAALVLDTSGKLAWDARVPAKTVTNFGKTPSLTVWKLKQVRR